MEPLILDNLVKTHKAKFVFQNFAFIGQESLRAAEASLCASDQGKFWPYHDLVFKSQAGENVGAFSDVRLQGFAPQAGLDATKFNACLAGNTHLTDVQNSIKLGQSWGVGGTPTVFVIDPKGNRSEIQNPESYAAIEAVVNSFASSPAVVPATTSTP